ncbi:hypothetical protein [Halodesulfurarchaeum formicicum]|nr:hypothetical protein [Halodesulfurarchaeum formicicum]
MRRSAAAGTAVAVGGTGTIYSSEEAEALVPLAPAAVAAGATAGAWLIREYDPLSIFENDALDIARDERIERVRESWMRQQNAVDKTIRGVKSLIEYAYNDWISRGKIDAVEGMVAGDSVDQIKDHAHSHVDGRVAVSQKNLIKQHQEMRRTVDGTISQLVDHPDVDVLSHLEVSLSQSRDNYYWLKSVDTDTETWTLADGSSIDVTPLEITVDEKDSFDDIDPTTLLSSTPRGVEMDSTHSSGKGLVFRPSSLDEDGNIQWSDATYTLSRPDIWSGIWTDLENMRSKVHADLDSWVDVAIDEVQSGMSPASLLSPGEISMMMSEDESDPSAVANMIALGVPVDKAVEYRMKIDGIEVWGILHLPDGGSVNVGDIYRPTVDDPLFASLDPSTMSGSWSEYQSEVSGGVVTFTSTPFPRVLYSISTSHSETVEVPSSEFSAESSSAGTYTADLSGLLDNQITSIESVTMRPHPDYSSGQMVTMTLADDQVEILEIRDEDGSTMDSTSTDEPYTPQSSDNYITEEEWSEMQSTIEDLTEQYEEEKQPNPGPGAILPGGIPDWALLVGAGAGGILALFGLTGGGR